MLLADVAVEPVSGLLNVEWLIVLALVWVVETLVLRALGWGSWGRCALDAFVANLVSSVLGLWLIPAGAWGLAAWLGAFAVSVLVEGVVLYALRRPAPGRLLRAALGANAVSYAVLYALVLVL